MSRGPAARPILPPREGLEGPAAGSPFRAGAMVMMAGLLWSLQGSAVKLIDESGAAQISFWRFYGQLVFLLLVVALMQRGRLIAAFRRAGWAAVLGGLLQAGASVAIVYALTLTSVANVTLVMATSPFWAALLAWMVLGERLTLATWLAMATALAGVVLMVSQKLDMSGLMGNLYALAVALLFAGQTVVLRWGRQVEMLPLFCWGGIFGTAASAALAGGAVAVPLDDAALALFMGGFMIALGMVCFVRGARYLPAGVLAFLTLTEVVLAPVWAWLAVGEVPAMMTLVGGAVVLAALVGQTLWESLRPRRRAAPARI